MKHDSSNHFVFAALLIAASSTSDAASPQGIDTSSLPGSAIAFGRSASNPDHTLRSASIFLTNPAGSAVRQLTPKVDGVYDFGASWSPHGTRIVFERGSARSDPHDRYDIYAMGREGQEVHQLTSGVGNFERPEWGPRGQIAFRSRYVDRDCVSVVDWNGLHQHDVFCPGHRGTEIDGITWSPDGRSLYASGGFYAGSPDLYWNALAYRVDLDTGVITLLTSQVMDDPMYLTFAPDGRYGLYAPPGYSNIHPITRVNFATDILTPLEYGHGPVFSEDGSKVAYAQGAPDYLVYDQIFVMNADGTGVRQLTHSHVENIAYTAVDWSRDGRRLLVNRAIFVDTGGLLVGTTDMRILDTDTGALKSLPGGVGTSWFEP